MTFIRILETTRSIKKSRYISRPEKRGSLQNARLYYVVYPAKALVRDAMSSRKHAYSNVLKISLPKTHSFQIKKKSFLSISLLKNIDCGYLLDPPRRGGSKEYPQSMFLSRNKKK